MKLRGLPFASTAEDEVWEATVWQETRRRVAERGADTAGERRKAKADREMEEDEERETDSGEVTAEKWHEEIAVAAIDFRLRG